jgi:hypothetical protein
MRSISTTSRRRVAPEKGGEGGNTKEKRQADDISVICLVSTE